VYGLCSIDLVLREKAAGLHLEDVETALDLGAVNVAVVPVGGPRAGRAERVRDERSAVEESRLGSARRSSRRSRFRPGTSPGP
jgi:hypothetical protein